MRKIYIGIACVLFILQFSAVGFSGVETTGPRILFENKSHHFKEVEEGTYLRHTFRVFNRGDSQLNIDRVSPG